MRVGRIIITILAVIGGFALLGVGVLVFRLLVPSRSDAQQNFAPAQGQQVASVATGIAVLSRSSGQSSFLYLKQPNGSEHRLTSVPSGIESEPSISHDGKLMVYAFAISPDSKSSVWMVGVDGSHPHQITGESEDALHPMFSPDDTTIFYAVSARTGNNSPIVRPARHDWDIFSVPVTVDTTVKGASPLRLTSRSFYQVRSVDASVVDESTSKAKILISTTEYPIGDVFEEFIVGETGRNKLFQPRVPGLPSVGPSFGRAYFMNKGMDILFLAATDSSSGQYDYNVFTMSDVTGSDIKQLTKLKGMTTDLHVLSNGSATLVNGGHTYLLDLSSRALKQL